MSNWESANICMRTPQDSYVDHSCSLGVYDMLPHIRHCGMVRVDLVGGTNVPNDWPHRRCLQEAMEHQASRSDHIADGVVSYSSHRWSSTSLRLLRVACMAH